MNFTVSKKTFRTLALIVGLALLAGCASTSGPRMARTHYSASQYLQMAANAIGNTKQAYLLQATDQLINEKQTRQAKSVLHQIAAAEDLPPNLQLKKQLVL